MQDGQSNRNRSLGPLFIASLCAAVGVVLVIRPYQWMNDDAYFYLKVALNHSRGLGSTFSGLAATNGYHPLWQWILCAAFDILKPDPETGLVAARLICWGFMVAALCLFYLFARKQFGRAWGAAATAVVSIFASRGVSCMEFWLQGFMLCCVLSLIPGAMSRQDGRSAGRGIFVGVVLALLVLARLDAIVVAGVVLASMLFGAITSRRNGSIFIAALLTFVACLCAYATMNYVQFGHIQSISSMLKTSFPVPAMPALHTILATKLAWPGLVAAFFILAWRSSDRFDDEGVQPIRWFALATLLHGALVLLFVRWPAFGIWWWMLSYFSMALCIGVFGSKGSSAGVATLIVVVAALWHTMAIADALIRYPDRPEGEMGRQFAAHLPADAVAFQVDATGMTSYLSDRTIINGDGLMNNMEYQRALAQNALDGYLARWHVTHIVHDEAEALGADVAGGDYRVARYEVPCHLDGTTTTLELRREDEVARWTIVWPGQLFPWPRDAHRQTFVVWQRRPG